MPLPSQSQIPIESVMPPPNNEEGNRGDGSESANLPSSHGNPRNEEGGGRWEAAMKFISWATNTMGVVVGIFLMFEMRKSFTTSKELMVKSKESLANGDELMIKMKESFATGDQLVKEVNGLVKDVKKQFNKDRAIPIRHKWLWM